MLSMALINFFILTLIFMVQTAISTTYPAECPDGWIGYKTKCYKVIKKYQTFDSAEEYCKRLHPSGHLASITSKREQRFINNLVYRIHDNMDHVWIGFVRYPKVHGKNGSFVSKYEWTDESDSTEYKAYYPNDPDDEENHDHEMLPDTRFCTGLWSRGGFQGRWYEFRCENNFQSVCQMILHDHARTNCPSASFPESSSVNVINFETSPYLLSVTIICLLVTGFVVFAADFTNTKRNFNQRKTQFNNWLVTIQNPQSSRPQQILTVRSVSTTIPPPLPSPTSTSSSINTISNNNHNPLLDTQSSVTQLTSVWHKFHYFIPISI